MQMKWEDYDPSWLSKLAAGRLPKNHWLIHATAECTRCHFGDRELWFTNPDELDNDGYLENVFLSNAPHSGVWIVATDDRRVLKVRPGWAD